MSDMQHKETCAVSPTTVEPICLRTHSSHFPVGGFFRSVRLAEIAGHSIAVWRISHCFCCFHAVEDEVVFFFMTLGVNLFGGVLYKARETGGDVTRTLLVIACAARASSSPLISVLLS